MTPSPPTGIDLGEPERQRIAAAALEEPLAAPEHDRKDHQPVLVDQMPFGEPLHELPAPGDEDVALVLGLQLRRLVGQVAAEHDRVVPGRLAERGRDDVLAHPVHLVGESGLVGPLGPGRREALVRHPAEQHRVGLHHLVELELVALVAALELERPAAVREVLGSARILHHAVERHELRYNDASHVDPSSVVKRRSLRPRRCPETHRPMRRRGRHASARPPPATPAPSASGRPASRSALRGEAPP